MWSDNETTVDLLGFQHLVAGVTSIVRNDRLLPATIGVFGDWGSGKSSLLGMVGSDLSSDEDSLVLKFNGWLFEGYGDAKVALMGNILDALAKDETLASSAKGLALKLLKRVNWWRVAGGLGKAGVGAALGGPAGLALALGTDIGSLAKDLAQNASELSEKDLQGFLKDGVAHEERRGIREFRDEFGELLASTKRQRLVVVIDDLDRCLPETIINTLEAIKLFLFVERTAFVVGADERLVQYAVRRRFPELPGERVDVGRDYLEKLIQFPIRVPPLSRSETERYIALLFSSRSNIGEEKFESLRADAVNCDPTLLSSLSFHNDVALKALGTVPADLASDLSLAERIAPVLSAETLGNPRQCKRFLNMLATRLEMARSRGVEAVQPRILAKLMLLEYYRTESFRQLASARADEQGCPNVLRLAEREYRAEADGTPVEGNEQGDSRPSPDTGAARSAATESLPAWLTDSWVTKWLSIDPPLSGEDLRPYFYFSRDALGPLSPAAARMSPEAQKAFRRLLSNSQAEQRLALDHAGALAPADASSVFEALSVRVREEDDHSGETSAFDRAIRWTQERPELASQLISLLSGVPDELVPAAAPMKLVSLATGPSRKSTVELIDRWCGSTTGTLRAAAQAARKRLSN